MDMYRLVIDFPLGENQEEAIKKAQLIVPAIEQAVKQSCLPTMGVKLMQYRLQNDDDRSVKNYLTINENGHAGNKKIKIEL